MRKIIISLFYEDYLIIFGVSPTPIPYMWPTQYISLNVGGGPTPSMSSHQSAQKKRSCILSLGWKFRAHVRLKGDIWPRGLRCCGF